MKKTLPVMPASARDAEAARLAGLTVSPQLELADLQSAIREGLLAFSCAAGLLVIGEMMQAEVAQVVGLKGRHDPERMAERNGSAAGSVVLGGSSVPVRRPRAVLVGGGEINRARTAPSAPTAARSSSASSIARTATNSCAASVWAGCARAVRSR
jgi:hypothetical protein